MTMFMLNEIFNNKYSQIVFKAIMKNQLSAIIEYPSYKIVACSEELSPENNISGMMPKNTQHDFSRFSKQHAKDAHQFRINKISSSWLVIFKRESLASLELFRLDDIPIVHNDELVGIHCSFTKITLNDILLISKLLNKNTKHDNVQISTSDDLSEMEREVLFFAALNKSNKQISNIEELLGIRKVTSNTIKTLMSQRIYKKLNVSTLDDAIVKAIETKQLDKIPESFLTSVLSMS